MTDKRDADYVLGSDPAELDRLGVQHQIWQAHTSALWERAGFGPGQALLDAGCGPGFASVDLAHLVGRQGSVLGVDDSAQFVADATARAAALGVRHAQFQQADLQQLELDAQSLDGAFMRWVISFVPKPARVFRRLAAALRPGAPLVLMDYIHYRSAHMFPDTPVFDELFEHFAQANRDSGGDYDNGGKAPAWAHDAGFDIEHMQPLTFLARPGDRYWQWFAGFCRVFAPRLKDLGLADDDFLARLSEGLERQAQDPRAFLMTPPVLALIARRR